MLFLRIIPIIAFLFALALITGKIIQLKQKGVETSGTKKGIRFILSVTFLLSFFLLFVTELLLQISGQEQALLPGFLSTEFHVPSFIKVIGAFLSVLSVLSLYFTLKAFKDSLRFGLNAAKRGKLISSGIFSVTRNPFFISVELFLIGTAMTIPSPFFIGIALLSVPAIHYHIVKEERFLAEYYGKEYRDYCIKVRRYF